MHKTGENSFWKSWGTYDSIQSYIFHSVAYNFLDSITMYLPLLVAIPCASALCKELNSGYSYQLLLRMGRKKYFFIKYFIVFINSILSTLIFSLYSFLLIVNLFPTYKHYSLNTPFTLVYRENLFVSYFAHKPVLYFIILTAFCTIYLAIIALLSLALTHIFRSRFIVTIIPFIFFFLIVF